jgi:hypothetical protein
MQARKTAAQFAAYVWFENIPGARPSEEAKAQFVQENWPSFLFIAPDGLGRLLLKIASGRSRRPRKGQPSRRRLTAAV